MDFIPIDFKDAGIRRKSKFVTKLPQGVDSQLDWGDGDV
jgi:hypothetical protein